MAIRNPEDGGKEAVTFYEVLERFRGYALVRCKPKTGRTHQIRVHLAHIGHPVLADKAYSGRDRLTLGDLLGPDAPDAGRVLLDRQALHAHALHLEHPITGAPARPDRPLARRHGRCPGGPAGAPGPEGPPASRPLGVAAGRAIGTNRPTHPVRAWASGEHLVQEGGTARHGDRHPGLVILAVPIHAVLGIGTGVDFDASSREVDDPAGRDARPGIFREILPGVVRIRRAGDLDQQLDVGRGRGAVVVARQGASHHYDVGLRVESVSEMDRGVAENGPLALWETIVEEPHQGRFSIAVRRLFRHRLDDLPIPEERARSVPDVAVVDQPVKFLGGPAAPHPGLLLGRDLDRGGHASPPDGVGNGRGRGGTAPDQFRGFVEGGQAWPPAAARHGPTPAIVRTHPRGGCGPRILSPTA